MVQSGENEREMVVYVEETARHAQSLPFTLERSFRSSAAPSMRMDYAFDRAEDSCTRSMDNDRRCRYIRCWDVRVRGREGLEDSRVRWCSNYYYYVPSGTKADSKPVRFNSDKDR